MPVDTGIYNALLQPPKSYQDYAREDQAQQQNALALQGARQNLLLNQQKADEYTRVIDEKNALRNYIGGGADLSTREGLAGLYKAAPTLAPDVLKNYWAGQETQSKIGKEAADTKATQLKTAHDTLDYAIQGLQTINDPQTAAAYISQGVGRGYWAAPDAQRMIASMPQDPAAFQTWRASQLKQSLSAKDQLPKFESQDVGGAMRTLAVDPTTGLPTVTSTTPKTISPADEARISIERFNAGKPTVMMAGDQGLVSVAPYSTVGKPVTGALAMAPGLAPGGSQNAGAAAPASVPVASAATRQASTASAPPNSLAMQAAPTSAAPADPAQGLGAKDYYKPEAMKAAADYGTQLNSKVGVGQDLMMRINEASQALSQFQPGMGAETRLNIARAAQAMGAPDGLVKQINQGDVAAKQEFMKLAAQQAMESLKQSMGGSGRITQAEFKVFQQNNPNIELDPNAIQKIYGFARRVYQRDLSEQQQRQQFMDQGGDPSRWPTVWAQRVDPTASGNVQTPTLSIPQPSSPGVAPQAANINGWKYLGVVK